MTPEKRELLRLCDKYLATFDGCYLPSRDTLNEAYRRLRSQHHPDRGGDAARFHEVETAYARACAELGI